MERQTGIQRSVEKGEINDFEKLNL